MRKPVVLDNGNHSPTTIQATSPLLNPTLESQLHTGCARWCPCAQTPLQHKTGVWCQGVQLLTGQHCTHFAGTSPAGEITLVTARNRERNITRPTYTKTRLFRVGGVVLVVVVSSDISLFSLHLLRFCWFNFVQKL